MGFSLFTPSEIKTLPSMANCTLVDHMPIVFISLPSLPFVVFHTKGGVNKHFSIVISWVLYFLIFSDSCLEYRDSDERDWYEEVLGS